MQRCSTTNKHRFFGWMYAGSSGCLQDYPTYDHVVTHMLHYFVTFVTCYMCRYVKDADKEIIANIKAAGRLVDHASLNHSYPFCWRSDTPLIYRAVPSWFVKVCVYWLAAQFGRGLQARLRRVHCFFHLPCSAILVRQGGQGSCCKSARNAQYAAFLLAD
jgi:hypothetical protein